MLQPTVAFSDKPVDITSEYGGLITNTLFILEMIHYIQHMKLFKNNNHNETVQCALIFNPNVLPVPKLIGKLFPDSWTKKKTWRKQQNLTKSTKFYADMPPNFFTGTIFLYIPTQ